MDITNMRQSHHGCKHLAGLSGLPISSSCTLTLAAHWPAAQAAFPLCTFGSSPTAVFDMAFFAAEMRAATAPCLWDNVQAKAGGNTFSGGHHAIDNHSSTS
jgi:hypothetical protein